MAHGGMTTVATHSASPPLPLGTATGRTPPRVFAFRFDVVGLAVGAFFAAVSLLPSLLPRVAFVQGVASGVTFMVGYGVGTSSHALWRYLGLPVLARTQRLVAGAIATLLAGLALTGAIWQFVGWQNEIRRSFGMHDLTPDVWPTVVGVALAIMIAVLVASRSLR
ncbi:MAG: hypothetical protein HGA51_07460, partial [Demequinaceae bacterium]|nr:hypothetical protein [Demequinaceae bacterium]